MLDDAMESVNKMTRECMLISATRVAARYAALNFYQQRQEQPLTEDEIKEIASGVDGEVGSDMLQLFKAFTGVSENEE